MIWTENINPRVWKGDALYVAVAWDNTSGLEGGYIGHIYEAPHFPEQHIRGTERWGRTFLAALTYTVRAFDPEATLPT